MTLSIRSAKPRPQKSETANLGDLRSPSDPEFFSGDSSRSVRKIVLLMPQEAGLQTKQGFRGFRVLGLMLATKKFKHPTSNIEVWGLGLRAQQVILKLRVYDSGGSGSQRVPISNS